MRKIFFLACSLVISSPAFSELPVYTAPKITKQISLRGTFDQWKDIPAIVLDDDRHYVNQTTLPRKGNTDLSLLAKLCYDDENLYLAVKVTDDVFTQKGLALEAWNGDSLQFAISDDGKYNYWECILALCQDKPMLLCYHAGNGIDPDTVSRKIQYSVKKIDATSLLYQAAIPWSVLRPLNASSDRFRFNFIVNEADDGPRKAWMAWANPSGIGENKNPADYGVIRLKREKVSAGSPLKGDMNLERNIYTDNDDLTAVLTVTSGKSIDGKVLFTLSRKGNPVIEQSADILISSSPTAREFHWNTGRTPGGFYELTAAILRKDGARQGAFHASFEKIDQKDVEQTVAEFQADGRMLQGLLRQCEQKKIPTPYQTAVHTMIGHFSSRIRDDLTIKQRDYNPLPDSAPLPEPQKIVGPVKALFWDRARRNADYIRDQVKLAIRQTEDLLKNPQSALAVPEKDLDSLTYKNGTFCNKNGPVLLVGAELGETGNTHDELKVISDYGFNFWGFSSGEKVYVDTPVAKWEDLYMRYPNIWAAYQRAAELNLAIMTTLRWYQIPVPSEAHDPGCQSGFIFDIEKPEQSAIISKYLQTLAGEVQKYKSHKSFALVNEVYYRFCTCSRGKRDFQKAMREKYFSIDKLNAQWGTMYKNFDDLTVPRDRKGNLGQWYDYNCMHQEKLPERLKWIVDQIRKVNPRSWTHTKTLNGMLDCWDYCVSGIDRERIGDVTDLYEFDGIIGYGKSGQFAFSPWSEVSAYDLHRSLKPEAPMMETEFHSLPDDYWGRIDLNHLKGCLWLGAIHGVDGFVQWIWYRNGYNRVNVNSINDHADRTHALSTAALDLRRLAKFIIAFPAQKSRVALYFSNPSLINRENQYNLLLDVYRGLYWLNAPPIDFITDRQIAAGKINDYKLIIVHSTPYLPAETLNKMKEFVRAGGHLVLTLDSAQFDPYGRPLNISDLLGQKVFPASFVHSSGKGSVYYAGKNLTMDQWTRYFADVYSTAGIPTGMLKLKDKTGRPLVGVEVREADLENHHLIYCMNFTCSPVEIPLPSQPNRRIFDLINCAPVRESSVILKPLVPCLLIIE